MENLVIPVCMFRFMKSSLFQDEYVHYCSSCYIHFLYECLRNPALRATLLQALWHFLSVLSQALFYITTTSLYTVYLCFCYYKCHIAHNQTQSTAGILAMSCCTISHLFRDLSCTSLLFHKALDICSFFRTVHFLELDLLKKMWVEIWVLGHFHVHPHLFLLPFWFLLQCSKDVIDWILLSVLFSRTHFSIWCYLVPLDQWGFVKKTIWLLFLSLSDWQ